MKISNELKFLYVEELNVIKRCRIIIGFAVIASLLILTLIILGYLMVFNLLILPLIVLLIKKEFTKLQLQQGMLMLKRCLFESDYLEQTFPENT
jgi:hypothetical protein